MDTIINPISMEERLANIEKYVLLAAKKVLTVEDVSVLTGLSKAYIYSLTCKNQIPFYKPNGKCIFFDKAEIEAWQKQNRCATIYEAEQNAKKFSE